MSNFHTSVLLEEAIGYLQIRPGEWYIDATLGGGGHTAEIIKRGGLVLGIDQDAEAIAFVRQNLPDERIVLAHGNFIDIKKIAEEHKFSNITGILLDLGVSSHQFDTSERGFSFMQDAPLDMRMDKRLGVTAADLIHALTKRELTELLTKFGEETHAWKIIPAIISAREKKKIETTRELAEIIEKVVPRKKESMHPATKVFQALRIAVNAELYSLRTVLPQAIALLRPKGRLVIISFHSLEDTIVKHAFLDFAEQQQGVILTKKPIEPGEEEIAQNPRSRSAKMRVFEKYE